MSAQKIILVILLGLFAVILDAQQNSNSPSFQNNPKGLAPNSEEFLKNQVQIALDFLYSDRLIEAKDFIDEVLKKDSAEQILPKNYIQHYKVKMWVCQANNDLVNARKYCEKSISIAQRQDDIDEVINLQLNLVSMLVGLKDTSCVQQAKKLIYKSKQFKPEDKELLLYAKHQLSKAYEVIGDYTQAINILLKLRESPEYQEYKHTFYGIDNSLAHYYLAIGDYDNSILHVKKAMRYPNKRKDEEQDLLITLSKGYKLQEEPDSMKYYIELAKDIGMMNNVNCSRLALLESSQLKQNKLYSEALQILHDNEKCFTEQGNVRDEIEFLLSKIDCLLEMKNYYSIDSLFNETEQRLAEVNREVEANYFRFYEYLLLKKNVAGTPAEKKLESYVNHQKKYNALINNIQLKTIDEKYDIEKLKENLDAINTRATLYRNLILFISIVLIVIVGLGIKYYKNKNYQIAETKELASKLKKEIQEISLANKSLQIEWDEIKEEFIKFNMREERSVKAKEIMYIESEKRSKKVNCKEIEIIIPKMNMDEIFTLLGKKHFIRVHRAFIINVHEVKIIEKNQIILKNNSFIPIGPSFRKIIDETFMNT